MTQHRRCLRGAARAALFAAIAAGVLYIAVRPAAYAADKDEPAPKATAAPIDFVPSDAVAFMTIRVGDLWAHPAVKAWRAKAGKELPEPFQDLRRVLGVAPDEIERVTLFYWKEPGVPLIAVTTLKPYDRKAILSTTSTDAEKEKLYGRSIFSSATGPSLHFLDERTFLVGRSGEMEEYLHWAPGKKEGSATPALCLASGKHLAVVGVDGAAFARSLPPSDKLPPEAKSYKALLKARLATLVVDLDDQLKANLRVTFAGEADAKEGAAALDAGLDLTRTTFAQAPERLGKADGNASILLKDVQAALKAAKADQKGATVEVEVAMKIDPDAITAELTEGVPLMEKAAKRKLISNDLKQLALSAIDYSTDNNKMLPAAVYDKEGKPLLSWRVLVLPYIEQGNLYKQFHLDEPWDSDHNKKLLEKMPTTFAPPNSQAFKDHETHFQAFVGKGTVFEKPGLRYPFDIPDGTSNTILFVDAKKAVPWTKPEDVALDDGKMLPKLGGLSDGGFMLALCDGSVQIFPLTMKEETLRIWVTRNNGQVRPDPDK